MALEQSRTIADDPNVAVVAQPNGDNGKQTAADGGDDGSRLPRLPRWTRHEILVLIQGKRVAESRVRRGGRTAVGGGGGGGSGQLEPKWAAISSYCKGHGANRGPVQCRKRWSNLAGDYRKIKEWELKGERGGGGGDGWQSYWVMRNDVRREKKLPGFFDKEVYDILDGVAAPPEMMALAVVEPKAEEEEAVFDSGRPAAGTDGLFSDIEPSRPEMEEEEEEEEAGESTEKGTVAGDSPVENIPAPTPISEKRYQPFGGGGYYGLANEGQPTPNPEKGFTRNEGRKRRRSSSDEDNDLSLQDQLIKILERNNTMLTAHLEAQNINSQLDRDQRKEQADGLITVLNKLADAIGRIADKM